MSLKKDRRNTHGENNKSSRKNIRRSKLSRMAQRRIVSTMLGALKGDVDETSATEMELAARQNLIEAQRWAFRKSPDSPLGKVIAQKLKKRRNRSVQK